MHRFLAFLFIAVLGGWGLGGGVHAQIQTQAKPQIEKRLEVRLLADQDAWYPSQALGLMIDVRHKPGWHTYFINPGEAGLGLKLKWSPNPALIISEPQWPAPEKKDLLGLVAYSYSGQSLYLMQLTENKDFLGKKPQDLQIDAMLNFLVCADICVPESHRVALSLPLATAPANLINQELFSKAKQAIPPIAFMGSQYETDGAGRLNLGIKLDNSPQRPKSIHIIPYDESLISPKAPQTLFGGDKGLMIKTEIIKSDLKGPIRALVMTPEGVFDVQFAPVKLTEGFDNFGLIKPEPSKTTAISVWTLAGFIGLALGGGLILNLMPCVFPILSMKLLALAKMNEDRSSAIPHALLYGAGVVLSFLGLALLLESLKGLGFGLGWGFQLQNPYVTGVLALVMVLVGLNLLGRLRWGGSLQGVGSGLMQRLGPGLGSFLSGVLAVIVAAPCTAPFMATAIGVALAQGGSVSLAIFLGLGVGFALPFVIFSLLVAMWPRFASFLPRPGPWMEGLQKLLAIPMFLTALWLIWVVSRQINLSGLLIFIVGLGLMVLGLSLWRARLGLMILSAVAIIIMLTGLGFSPPPSDRLTPLVRTNHVAFSAEQLSALRAQGRPVFIDMTAAWCVTCKVNQELVIETKAMKKAFEDTNTVLMVGDWTHQDPEITAFIQSHNRSGVPLYVYYPPHSEPIILEPILNKEKTISLIKAGGD